LVVPGFNLNVAAEVAAAGVGEGHGWNS
jgi:hypothetical protein